MDKAFGLGRFLFGAAIAFLGAQQLAALFGLILLVFHATAPLAVLHEGIARTRALETLAFLHFLYAPFVAAAIPSWIPGPLAWAYATGVAMIAAGLGLLAGVRARLAAGRLGLMFLFWFVLLHAPRVGAHLAATNEWNSAAVALAMGGAAWLIGDTLRGDEAALTNSQAKL